MMQPETHRSFQAIRDHPRLNIRRGYHHVGFGGGLGAAVNKLKVNVTPTKHVK